MNYLPRNTWELERAVWRCYASEVNYKKERATELHREAALDDLLGAVSIFEA